VYYVMFEELKVVWSEAPKCLLMQPMKSIIVLTICFDLTIPLPPFSLVNHVHDAMI
jgi:hypothetical protein